MAPPKALDLEHLASAVRCAMRCGVRCGVRCGFFLGGRAGGGGGLVIGKRYIYCL